MKRKFVVKGIEYDTDGEEIDDLPETLTITVPEDIEDDDVEEYLSDEISNITGFCHKGFTIEGEVE
jgi:hypothetical protein